jgi:hypothetical protein
MVARTLVVRPGEGRSVSLGGMGVVFKVSGADTGGAYSGNDLLKRGQER